MYTKTNWTNYLGASISAGNMNKIEQGIFDAFVDKTSTNGYVTVGIGGNFATVNDAWNAGNRRLKLLSGFHQLSADLIFDVSVDADFKIEGMGPDITTLDYQEFKLSIIGTTGELLFALDMSAIITFITGSKIATYTGTPSVNLAAGVYIQPNDEHNSRIYQVESFDSSTITLTENFIEPSISPAWNVSTISRDRILGGCSISNLKLYSREPNVGTHGFIIYPGAYPLLRNFTIRNVVLDSKYFSGGWIHNRLTYDSAGDSWIIDNFIAIDSIREIYTPPFSICENSNTRADTRFGITYANCILNNTSMQNPNPMTFIGCYFPNINLYTYINNAGWNILGLAMAACLDGFGNTINYNVID